MLGLDSLRNDGNEELRLTAHRLWSSSTPGSLWINDQQIWQENSQVSGAQTFTDRPLQPESDGEGVKSGILQEGARIQTGGRLLKLKQRRGQVTKWHDQLHFSSRIGAPRSALRGTDGQHQNGMSRRQTKKRVQLDFAFSRGAKW